MGAVTHIGKISLKFEEIQDTIISLSFELKCRKDSISVPLIPVDEAPVVMKEYEYIPFLAAGTFEEKGTRFAKFKVSLSLSDSKSCKFKTNKDNSDSKVYVSGFQTVNGRPYFHQGFNDFKTLHNFSGLKLSNKFITANGQTVIFSFGMESGFVPNSVKMRGTSGRAITRRAALPLFSSLLQRAGLPKLLP